VLARQPAISALHGPVLSARGEHVHFYKCMVRKNLYRPLDILSEGMLNEYEINRDETKYINLFLKENKRVSLILLCFWASSIVLLLI
jgi:hypothetical protein